MDIGASELAAPPLPEMASAGQGHTGGADGAYYYKTDHAGVVHEAPGNEHSRPELPVSAYSHGGSVWSPSPGTGPNSAVTYELDSGVFPGAGGGGYPQHAGGHGRY
jgi:hypothetical protein